MTPSAKRYTVQIICLMTAYMILLLLSLWLLGNAVGTWRVVVAVLPAIPLLFVVWCVIRFVRQMDELQKSIHLDAITFSFLLTTVITLTYGFLENAGLPQISVIYVPVLMCIFWGIGAGIASRRYR